MNSYPWSNPLLSNDTYAAIHADMLIIGNRLERWIKIGQTDHPLYKQDQQDFAMLQSLLDRHADRCRS